MRILAFDTSAKTASVALMENGKTMCEFYLSSGFTHSETVLPMAQSVLKQTGYNTGDIDVFAVNCGPGSFTGLRIGIAAVKALAMAGGKPCAAVSSLEALAYNTKGMKGIICPVMDARCNQVYSAFFENDGKEIKRLSEDRTVMTENLKEEIRSLYPGRVIIFTGDGTDLMLKGETDEYLISAPEGCIFGHASCVAAVGEKLCGEGKLQSAGEITPNYLKLAQAEKEKLEREGKL